jgi:copper(I)-binding protein
METTKGHLVPVTFFWQKKKKIHITLPFHGQLRTMMHHARLV